MRFLPINIRSHCALPRIYVLSSLFPPLALVLDRVEVEPRAVFLHLFRGVHFLPFSAFSGWWVELFTVPFDECSDSMQEAITGATATIIYGLRMGYSIILH